MYTFIDENNKFKVANFPYHTEYLLSKDNCLCVLLYHLENGYSISIKKHISSEENICDF